MILYPAASFASGRASKYFPNSKYCLSDVTRANRLSNSPGGQALNSSTVYDLNASQYASSSIFHAPGPAPHTQLEFSSLNHSVTHESGSIEAANVDGL